MTSKSTVIVDPFPRTMDEIFSPPDLRRLHATVDVVWGRDEPMPLEPARAALGSAAAVVCGAWRYGHLPSAPYRLRAIVDVAGQFPQGVDYARCFAENVRVLTAAPGFGPQVAEMALALALAAAREVTVADRTMRAGTEKWLHDGNRTSFLLSGKPVGFIGLGTIGRCLKDLLTPFECPISVYDPWLGDGFLRSHRVRPASLDELMGSSHVVFVLAAPSTENRALLDRALLERLRPGAVLVLISRAHVVDFDALTELVLAGRFKAAIDVFPEEPLPVDHPIRSAELAVLSPHRAGSVREGMWELGRLVVDDLEAIVRGLPPQRLQAATPELISRLTIGEAQRGQ